MALLESFERTPTFEVSSDKGLLIPVEILAKYGIQPGQKLQFLVYKDQIILMPEVHPRDVRGSMPDLDTMIERYEDRI